jgi:hypothetical protein
MERFSARSPKMRLINQDTPEEQPPPTPAQNRAGKGNSQRSVSQQGSSILGVWLLVVGKESTTNPRKQAVCNQQRDPTTCQNLTLAPA